MMVVADNLAEKEEKIEEAAQIGQASLHHIMMKMIGILILKHASTFDKLS